MWSGPHVARELLQGEELVEGFLELAGLQKHSKLVGYEGRALMVCSRLPATRRRG